MKREKKPKRFKVEVIVWEEFFEDRIREITRMVMYGLEAYNLEMEDLKITKIKSGGK